MSLFGNRRAQGAATQPQRPTRAEAKAGRMVMTGTTVTALPEKGLIFVDKDDSGLTSFHWMNRDTNIVEEQLIVFPHSQKFMRCKSAPESSRVFYLKMNDTRHFFWMQDADASKDEENCANLNKAMNGEPLSGSSSSSQQQQQSGLMGLPGFGEMNNQQLLQMLGMAPEQLTPGNVNPLAPPALSQGNRAVSRTAQGSSNTASSSAMDESTLSTDGSAVRELNSASNDADEVASNVADAGDGVIADGGVEGAAMSQQQQQLANLLMQGLTQESLHQGMLTEGASLSDVLTVDNISPLLADPDVVDRLASHLPEDAQHTREEILDTIRSPQFAQRLHSFTAALQSGELGPVMSQFGVDPSSVLGAGVLGLLESLEAEAAEEDEAGDNSNMDATED